MTSTKQWTNTKRVVAELLTILHCGICKKILSNPVSLGRCEHFFCRSCVHLGKPCPLCGVPSHVKDVQPNRQLGEAASLCERLMAIVQQTAVEKKREQGDADQRFSGTKPKEGLNRYDENREILTTAEESCVSNSNLEVDINSNRTCLNKFKIAETKLCQENVASSVENSTLKRTRRKELAKMGLQLRNIPVVEKQRSKDVDPNEGNCFAEKLHDEIELLTYARKSHEDGHRKNSSEDHNSFNEITPLKNITVEQTPFNKMADSVKMTGHRPVLEELRQRKGDATGLDSMDDLIRNEDEQHDNTPLLMPTVMEVPENNCKRRKLLTNEMSCENTGATRTDTEWRTQKKGVSSSRNNKNEFEPILRNKSKMNSSSSLKGKAVPVFRQSNYSSSAENVNLNNSNNLFRAILAKDESVDETKNPRITDELVSAAVGTGSTDGIKLLYTTPKSCPPWDVNFHSGHLSSCVKSGSSLHTEGEMSPLTPRSSSCRRNKKGETQLHVSCIKGEFEIVHSLLKDGENPNVRDFANWTPLHEACNHGHVKIAELLLNYGALINAPGGENTTPLHDAVQNYRLDCVRLLVSRGASKTLRDIRGKTPVDLALSSEMKEALNAPVTRAECSATFRPVSTLPTVSQSATLLMTGLDIMSKTSVMECAKKLNWKVVDSFTNEVTHLITSANKDGICMRTIKYLQAVLTGKWIVGCDWIRACNEASSYVSEELFEIVGSTHSPRSYAPRKGRLCMSQQLPLLFSGCHFYFHGEFHHPSPSKDDLCKLVKLGSGVVLGREPKQEIIDQSDIIVPYHANPESCLANCSYFVVVDRLEDELTVVASRLCRVNPSWILSSVAEFCLTDKQYQSHDKVKAA